jgi:hypothetical protein
MVSPVKVGEIGYIPPISRAHDIDVGGRPLDDLLFSYLLGPDISNPSKGGKMPSFEGKLPNLG